MSFDSKDKIILVTGASSGIGMETARAFARKGARLALTGRNIEMLKVVSGSIKKEGGSAEMFPFDLTNISGIPELVKKIQSHFNESIDVVVNSAGVAVLGTVENIPVEAYSYNLQVNFVASLALIKEVMPGMKNKMRGQIINISSGVGKRGLPGVSSYCVSKFALNALTESLRVELSPYNIDVILFSPGLTATEFSERTKIYGEIKESFISGKTVLPERIAEKIVEASEKSKREVMLSLRAKVSYHLNYWAPRLFDYILKRSLR